MGWWMAAWLIQGPIKIERLTPLLRWNNPLSSAQLPSRYLNSNSKVKNQKLAFWRNYEQARNFRTFGQLKLKRADVQRVTSSASIYLHPLCSLLKMAVAIFGSRTLPSTGIMKTRDDPTCFLLPVLGGDSASRILSAETYSSNLEQITRELLLP